MHTHTFIEEIGRPYGIEHYEFNVRTPTARELNWIWKIIMYSVKIILMGIPQLKDENSICKKHP